MNVITFHDAELNAAEKMRDWGYADAVATTGGSDGGIDVRSRGALAQVKFYRTSKSTRPEVQKLYGSRGHGQEKLLFFTSIGYTAEAVAYANHEAIALFTYDGTGTTHPVNALARSFQPGSIVVRTWKSPEYVALWRAVRLVLRVLAGQPTKHSSNKYRTRRRASSR